MSCTPLHVNWYWDHSNLKPTIVIDNGNVVNPPWIASLWYSNFWAGSRLVNSQHFDIKLKIDVGKKFVLSEYHSQLNAFSYNFTIKSNNNPNLASYICDNNISQGTLELMVSPEFAPCGAYNTKVFEDYKWYYVYKKPVNISVLHCPKPKTKHQTVRFDITSMNVAHKNNKQAYIVVEVKSDKPWPLLMYSGNLVQVIGIVSGTKKIGWWSTSLGKICIFPKHPDDPYLNKVGEAKYYNIVKKYYTQDWMSRKSWTI